jgi:short-subunit dehydrogenase
MNKFANKTVLITGGASGIGKIMSRLALERGAKVVIWDVNASMMTKTVDELSPVGTVVGYRVDIADYEQVVETVQKVKAEVGNIDILINNAGIVSGDYFHLHAPADITKTIAVNLVAPMLISHIFLQDMINRKSGHICNIASMAGLISNPKMAVYAASKWGMVGWSDSLRLEMIQQKTQVKITTILPYYINTGMFDGVRSCIPLLDPEKSALRMIRAIENDRFLLSMPWSGRFVRLMQGLLPVKLFDLVIGKWAGVYQTMQHFTGRKTD